MTKTNIRDLPSRNYAHPFDRPVRMNGDDKTHGVDPSPNAIGGFYGMGWFEHFRCHRTGNIYQVHCSDGVNGGKSAHSDRDLGWMQDAHSHIHARTTKQARTNKGPIRLSTREWAIMLSMTFAGWLDPALHEQFDTVGDRNRHMDEGVIGTINQVSVIVDPEYRDDLPKPGHYHPGFSPMTVHEISHQPSKFSGAFAEAFARATTG